MYSHISLHVKNLDQSVTFYETLLGQSATKRLPDYAKFDYPEGNLVLSLVPGNPAGPGQLSHLGFRVEDAKTLQAHHTRLQNAGLPLRVEEKTTCCYAVQDKFWATDPDGVEWEFYHFLEDAVEKETVQNACCAN